jgi:hypothetical protein
MRSPVTALVWEFWNANRRGWQIVLLSIPLFAALNFFLCRANPQSEGLRFLAFLPMVMSMILAMAFCNFTDRSRRDGIAGFPRHLFVLPVTTRFLVTCALGCSLVSVLAVYVSWAALVLRPFAIDVPIRWPITLLAAGIVFYQSIVWCLCGYRLTRVVTLSLGATMLVGIAFVPTLAPPNSLWASEANLSAMLAGATAFAYGATLVTVDTQRRGGARGWAGINSLIDSIAPAMPRRHTELKSPDAALFWLEWRRAGLILPAAVLLTTLLILGPVLSITERGEKETLWAEMWLAILPVLLAFPIGLGFGKPDFWSLDVSMSPFIATRPITPAQLIAAKMKAAALSSITSWSIVLAIAPAWIYLTCDTEHWGHMWRSSGMLYAPFSQWALPVLTLVGAMLLTWSLLVRSVWLGYAGRPAFYYSFTGIGLAAFLTAFFFFIWWLDHPRSRGDTLVGMLHWLPWALAAAVTAKLTVASFCARMLQRRQLASARSVATYGAIWLLCTALLVCCAWLMAPRIEWFRNMMMLSALVAIPCASIVLAPLAISWNRHR